MNPGVPYKRPDYKSVNIAWGRAKTSYIRSLTRKGKTEEEAKEAWREHRAFLKTKNTFWPPDYLREGKNGDLQPKIDATFKKQDKPKRDWGDAIAGGSRDPDDESKRQRLERLQKAFIQREEFLAEQRKRKAEEDLIYNEDLSNFQLSANSVKKFKENSDNSGVNSEQTSEKEDHNSANSLPQVSSELNNLINDELDNFDFNDDIRVDSTEEFNDKITMGLTRLGTDYSKEGEPPNKKQNPGEETNMETAPGGAQEIPPPQPPAAAAGGAGGGAGGAAQPGAVAPGRNAARGTGGGAAGGLAGAGNNEYFHGWAKSTVPRDPPNYEYTDTYRRPYQIHSNLPDPTAIGTVCHYDPSYWKDRPICEEQGYSGAKHKITVSHQALVIPYWIMEASIKDHDWNKPPDHIAYKLEEIGFTMPNMRLNVMNNPRKEVTDVAPAPPADARLWTFIDIFNDYGIPIQQSDLSKFTHSNNFLNEDFGINNDPELYQLPTLTEREFFVEPGVLTAVQANRTFKQGTGNTMESPDPHAFYEMKRHPGYKEFRLSEANFGLSYKVNAPIIRLDHPPNGTLDCHVRQSQTGAILETHQTNVNQWQMIFKGETTNTSTTNDPWNQAQLNFYLANQSGYTQQIIDSTPQSANQQIMQNTYGSHYVLPTGNAAISLPYTETSTRTMGRYDTSDDGKIHSEHLSKRPPLFLIGIYKEYEYKQDGAAFWRYELYGQIEYYCKIKWYVQPNRVKPYLAIGLGGLYTDTAQQTHNRQNQITWQRVMRQTMKPILNSTKYEKDQPNSVFF